MHFRFEEIPISNSGNLRRTNGGKLDKCWLFFSTMPISLIYSSQEKKQPSWDLSDVQRFVLNELSLVENDAFASRRLHHDVAVVDAPVGAPEKEVVAIQTNLRILRLFFSARVGRIS